MTPPFPPIGGEAPARAVRDALEQESHVLGRRGRRRGAPLPLTRPLRDNGFAVSAARDGREMRDVLANAAPPVDLVLLDVMLPGASGKDLLREIGAPSREPVMMLTARGEETDRVLG